MKRPLAATVLFALLLASGEWNPAEQAQLGRSAWRNALAALRAGDSSTALSQLRIAHEAWPAQPTYSEALVRLAARLDDSITTVRTLELLATQGLGASAASDSVVTAFAEARPSVAHARDRVLQSSAGPNRSVQEVVSADSLFFPEGLSIDSRDGTRFITSLRRRNVWIAPTDGAGRWLLPEAVDGRGAVFGVQLAADGASLWLTLAPTPHMGVRSADSSVIAELWQVERASGGVMKRISLGDGKGSPGELAVHADGTVLVSDAVLGCLYKLSPGANRVTIVNHPLLRSPQGIAVSGGGRIAIVADWSHGLLRWDLATDEIRALISPNTMALLGIDGLMFVDGALVAVQNGVNPMRILRLRLDGDAQRVVSVETLDRPSEPAGEFTVAATLGRDIIYVSSSSWPFWNEQAQRIAGSGPLPPVTLRRFRLPE